MNLTISEVRSKLFNKEMLELLVLDYETSQNVMGNLENVDKEHVPEYFKKDLSERANIVATHIQNHLNVALYNKVKEILEENERK